jgi:hypothetical protein
MPSTAGGTGFNPRAVLTTGFLRQFPAKLCFILTGGCSAPRYSSAKSGSMHDRSRLVACSNRQVALHNIGSKLADIPFGHDPSSIQDGKPLGDVAYKVQILLDQKDRALTLLGNALYN